MRRSGDRARHWPAVRQQSVQFFAGRQGRRCFISGSQFLRQHWRCVDLAIVLGTGQQLTDKSVQFFTGGQNGRPSRCRRAANQRQKALTGAGLQWRRSRCRTAHAPACPFAEDARKGRFSRLQGPVTSTLAGLAGERVGKPSAGVSSVSSTSTSSEMVADGGRRGRSRHDRRCASGDGAKADAP